MRENTKRAAIYTHQVGFWGLLITLSIVFGDYSVTMRIAQIVEEI